MPIFWDPKQVLGINPHEDGFSCSAIVKPKKKKGKPQGAPRRCQQTMIKNESKNQACRLLDTCSQIDVVSDGVSERLARELVLVAELTSCGRYHASPEYSQAKTVGAKWKEMVVEFVAKEKAVRTQARRERVRVAQEFALRVDPEPHVESVRVVQQRPVNEIAQRAREDSQQAPIQHRPRHQTQHAPPQQPVPQAAAYYPQQANPSHHPQPQQPYQYPPVPMEQPYDHVANAAIATGVAAERRTAQEEVRVRHAADRERQVVRNWVDPILEQNRHREPQPYVHQPVDFHIPGSAADLSRPILVERVAQPIDDGLFELRLAQSLRRQELAEENLRDILLRRQELEMEILELQERAERLRNLDDANDGVEIGPAPAELRRPAPQAPTTPIIQAPVLEAVVPRAAPAPQPYVPRRRPLESCFVCLDDFEGPEGVIWCMGQCGQNIHKACYDEWHRSTGNVVKKCAFCRQRWVEDP